MSDKKGAIERAVAGLTDNYLKDELFTSQSSQRLPDRAVVIEIIKELRGVIFPGYFGTDTGVKRFPEHYFGYILNHLYDKLEEQIETAFRYENPQEDPKEIRNCSEGICDRFFEQLPKVQELLLKDVQAGFDGDPAAKSKEEIIVSYPGLFAIYVYRLAHLLYSEKVPLIPRIMSEYAHNTTGIDINPGADIGEYFFIDHGTGVVIGETTEIGDNVKLYQGVTLGALSTRKGQLLANVKRHPTIHDKVTIYSNSSVLGGETVVGEGTIIGGNTFLTETIPAFSKVNIKNPELEIRNPEIPKENWDHWEI